MIYELVERDDDKQPLMLGRQTRDDFSDLRLTLVVYGDEQHARKDIPFGLLDTGVPVGDISLRLTSETRVRFGCKVNFNEAVLFEVADTDAQIGVWLQCRSTGSRAKRAPAPWLGVEADEFGFTVSLDVAQPYVQLADAEDVVDEDR